MSEWRKPKPENAEAVRLAMTHGCIEDAVIEAVMQMEDTLAAAVLAVQADNNRRIEAEVMKLRPMWEPPSATDYSRGFQQGYDRALDDLRAALASPAEPGGAE